MKITLKELYGSYGYLVGVCAQKPTNIKLAYKLGRIFKSAKAEYEPVHERHVELLRACGAVEDERGGLDVPKARKNEWAEKFQPQLDELLTVEVEVWGDEIKLGEIDGQLTLSGVDFAALSWLFVEGEAAPVEQKAKAAEV